MEATAAGGAARFSTYRLTDQFADRFHRDRNPHGNDHFARLPLVYVERRDRYPAQRRYFGGRQFIGRRRGFRELVMTISAQDRNRISDAIRAAEAKTSGEIACVLART